MRQVGDTLVWLALIVVVAAVLYVTPLVAGYISSREKDSLPQGQDVAWSTADPVDEPAGW